MKAQQILFIAPTRIGDAVLATSVLEHIRLTTPDARVTIVTSPLAAPLFEGYPLLARIIPMTKQTYSRHWIAAWRKTFGTSWHAVWDIRNSVLGYILRTRTRHSYTPQAEAPKIKQFEKSFDIQSLPYPTLWPRTSDIQAAQTILPDGTNYLVLAPIANWAPKEWPLEHFITAAKSLLNGTCKNYRPAIICAGHEAPKALPVLEALAEFKPIDLTSGELPLLSIFACMQRAHGFIGNDSGLMHMAAAAGIPTLGLFGPTPFAVYQPWGSKATYLHAPEDDLAQLQPATVVEKFATML